MSSYSSGKRLERFFAGKGFYIVLFLCAAVIGVSAWIMADGNETMDKNSLAGIGETRVETIVIPAQQDVEEEALPVQAPENISMRRIILGNCGQRSKSVVAYPVVVIMEAT